jgi:hypothetical protein
MTGYTPELVEARLIEAAKTLARMPDDMKALRRAQTSFWRDILPEQRAPSPLGRPGAGAIDRMHEAWQWLSLVETIDARKIVLARALGCTWRRLEDLDGRSAVTLRKVHREALAEIAAEINLRTPLQSHPDLVSS